MTKKWYDTKEACQRLNVCSRTLARMRKRKELKKGTHWKVKNPSAKRLTYLYNVSAIDEAQSEVITEVPTTPLSSARGVQTSWVENVKPYPIS